VGVDAELREFQGKLRCPHSLDSLARLTEQGPDFMTAIWQMYSLQHTIQTQVMSSAYLTARLFRLPI
jgi:hypothetical protein